VLSILGKKEIGGDNIIPMIIFLMIFKNHDNFLLKIQYISHFFEILLKNNLINGDEIENNLKNLLLVESWIQQTLDSIHKK
jgi:hypothetical protein